MVRKLVSSLTSIKTKRFLLKPKMRYSWCFAFLFFISSFIALIFFFIKIMIKIRRFYSFHFWIFPFELKHVLLKNSNRILGMYLYLISIMFVNISKLLWYSLLLKTNCFSSNMHSPNLDFFFRKLCISKSFIFEINM